MSWNEVAFLDSATSRRMTIKVGMTAGSRWRRREAFNPSPKASPSTLPQGEGNNNKIVGRIKPLLDLITLPLREGRRQSLRGGVIIFTINSNHNFIKNIIDPSPHRQKVGSATLPQGEGSNREAKILLTTSFAGSAIPQGEGNNLSEVLQNNKVNSGASPHRHPDESRDPAFYCF